MDKESQNKNNAQITEMIECPCCKYKWEINTHQIPHGMMYEIVCPSCETLIMRVQE